ncbi:calmodulin-like 3 [Linnemannia zychae]|nr:calmodulin-like 3 [Linnemannia zychae]
MFHILSLQLQKTASNNLTPTQIADLKQSFDTFDRNRDGTISRTELRTLLYTVGHKDQASLNVLSQYDADQSGTIDFQEFLNLASLLIKNKTANFSQDELASFRESFGIFDKNGDGVINASELRSLLRMVGEKFQNQNINETMQQFDTNKDGQIDFEEFLVLVNKITKNKTPISP